VIDSVKSDNPAANGWFYFNNDYDAVGVENGKRMMGLVGGNNERLDMKM